MQLNPSVGRAIAESTIWPFGRRDANSPEAAWDGSWNVGAAENDGRPMIIRKNQDAGSLVGDPRFPVRVGVAVPFSRPDENGMPTPDEQGPLAELEDLLFAALQETKRAIGVLTITTSGMREFVFYADDGAWAEGLIDGLRSRVRYELQSYSESDPEWTIYRGFEL